MAKAAASRAIYLAALAVWALFCLHLGWEGCDLAFAAMGAPAGPNPFPMAAGGFIIGGGLLVASAARRRRWSPYLLLILALGCVMWFGAALQFALPLRAPLIWLAAGLALLALALTQFHLDRAAAPAASEPL